MTDLSKNSNCIDHGFLTDEMRRYGFDIESFKFTSPKKQLIF